MHQCLQQTYRLAQFLFVFIYASITCQEFHSFSQFLRLRHLCCDDCNFQTNQKQCASFSINVAILFLSFKWTITAPNKLIDSQLYKRHRRKTLIAFLSLSHFTLTTTQLNLSFLKTLHYLKMIQRLVLSFPHFQLFHSNATKTQATFWSEVHHKLMTNLELSYALAHVAKPVLSIITQRKCRDSRNPLRLLIISRAPPPRTSIA